MRGFLSIAVTSVLVAGACQREPPVAYKQPPAGSYTIGIRQVKIGDSTVPVEGAAVTADFFKAANVPPMIGRLFVAEEHGRQTPAVTALSHDFWKERFDSSPQIIGRMIDIDGLPTTIVAVMPRGFALPGATRLWTPR